MSAEPASGVLARYDQDEAFRSRLIAMYQADRSGFISAAIRLAVSEGYGRPESVALAKAVCARMRAHAEAAEAPAYAPGDRVEVCLPDKSRRRGGGLVRDWFGGTVRAVDLPGLPPGVKVDLDREVNGLRDCYATRAEVRPEAAPEPEGTAP